MQTMQQPESVTLYYREGSSDKVYQAAIDPQGSGFVVTFAYGRRGSTLKAGAKTVTPVAYETARKIFDKLVSEKTGKGYTLGESGTTYTGTEKAERTTGIVPQLCNAIEEKEAQKLIREPGWWVQEKFDGRRLLIRKSGNDITGINRSGLTVAIPAPIANGVWRLDVKNCLIDGEAVGNVFWAFDLLQEANLDLRPYAYHKRYGHLCDLLDTGDSNAIRLVTIRTTTEHKQAFIAELKNARAEGVVFKRVNAVHTPGRPASGGDWLKFKFTATASCIVAGTNGSKRSIRLELIREGHRVGVGSVTIPSGKPVPAKGSIAEIRYLYAFPGGALFQPVYLGERDDIQADACTVGQLKLKAEDAEA